MSHPLDTPERRTAIHGSPEVSAAKHLARTYGVSMRRHRRLGSVAFDIGLGGTTRASYAAFGEITFTDTGNLDGGNLFGLEMGAFGVDFTMLTLGSTLEFGALPLAVEESTGPASTTLVVDAVPEVIAAITGTVLVLEPELAREWEAPLLTELTVNTGAIEVPTTTISVPVYQTITMLRSPRPRTRAQLRQDAAELVPAASPLWARFFLGLVMVLQLLGVVWAFTFGVAGLGWLTLSVITAIFGLPVLVLAVRGNDERLVRLDHLASLA